MSDGGIQTRRKRGYTLIYNDMLIEGMSARAWGVFCYLLSKPDGWETRMSDLQRVFKEGRDALAKARDELEALGYLRRETYIEDGLQRIRFVMDADQDKPATAQTPRSAPESGFQEPETPSPGTPSPEKPSQVSTDVLPTTERPTTESAATPSTATPEADDGRRRRATGRTRVPPDFDPTPGLLAWASERVPTVDVGSETEKFINWHLHQGTLGADWNAAWRNWMLKAAEFGPSKVAVQAVAVEARRSRWATRAAAINQRLNPQQQGITA